jgi:glycosyltransferase involved in cell wall biosynthesis
LAGTLADTLAGLEELRRSSAVVFVDSVANTPLPTRTLAGSTVLQIVPTLADSHAARATLNIALALVRAGARAIVASEGGPRVGELQSFGGEWKSYSDTMFNPIKLKGNVEHLARLMTTEHVDIVHARSASAAWSAQPVAERLGIKLVTEVSDVSYAQMLFGAFQLRAAASGDRVITHSSFDTRPIIERYRIAPSRMKVIPRTIDTSAFDPARVPLARVVGLRQAWGIPSGTRVVLVPGRVAPWNGQITLVEAAHRLARSGMSDVMFVLAGDDRRHPSYARAILAKAQELGVRQLFRPVGHFADLPSAFATADIVVMPCIKPPVTGRMVAEAQAMGKPVIASAIGPLPENLLAPPRVPEELRTGWLIEPNNAEALANTLETALWLDDEATSALELRARQFATYMFAPESTINATLDVYNSLLQAGS